MPSDNKVKEGLLDRSNKGGKSLGTAIFVGLRTVDPFLQYNILSNGAASVLVKKLGGSVLPQGPALVTNTPLDSIVGLSPYRTILLAMSVVTVLKHNYWELFIHREQMTPFAGTFIGMFNNVFNTINNLIFICAQTSASVNGEHFPQTPLLVGSALFFVGIAIELLSEIQRDNFKKDPKNKGVVFQGGLFSLVRHANYFGYLLWRIGYSTAAGGWTWGAVNGAAQLVNFTQAAIPELQSYCENRYGAQYEQYKKAVPYKLIPYVY